MSNTDSCILWLPNAEKTALAGASLAATIYTHLHTILLSGELGAGKTTFLKGLAAALGIRDDITSPTFALEQRYETKQRGIFLHVDLYRLTQQEAMALVASSDDHEGIRCIEWPERLGSWSSDNCITITLRDEEQRAGRMLTVSFGDARLPSRRQIEEWRDMVRLPHHVRDHCDAVALLCRELAAVKIREGTIVRQQTLECAGALHDLFRFVDFRPDTGPSLGEATPEDHRVWQEWKDRYINLHHEAACTAFLHEQGYGVLAEIIRVHGLMIPSPRRDTIEQKLLFYADKRIIEDRRVSVDERFEDFIVRYGKGKRSKEADHWYREAVMIEQGLFPAGAP